MRDVSPVVHLLLSLFLLMYGQRFLFEGSV